MRGRLSIAALSIALLGGCGGGDEGGSEATGSTDSFAAQASAICLDGSVKTAVDAQLEFGQVQPDERTQLKLLERYQEVLGDANDQLAALEPPADLAGRYAEFLSARTQSNSARGKVLAALQAGDQGGADAGYEQIGRLDSEAYDLAGQLGLDGCDVTLPPDQEEAVKETVEKVASSTDGELICNEYVYPQFLDHIFGDRGGVQGCIRFQEDPANVSDVSIESVSGYDGAYAVVSYTKIGGSDDGLRIEERYFYDDEVGHWRLWDSEGKT
jgi:hypothetical protein